MTDKELPKIPPVKKPITIENPDDYEPPEIKLAIIERPYNACKHENLKIYPHHRIVQCKDCHQQIDPFDYLLDIARDERWEYSNVLNLKNEAKRLREKVLSIEKEVAKRRRELKKVSGND